MVAFPEIKPFYDVDETGHLWLSLHPGQTAVYEDTAHVVCLLCGSQYGKTTIGPCWLHREMNEEDGTTPIFGDYLVVTATFPLLRNKMLPELRKYFETYLKWGEWKAGEKVFESFEKYHGAPGQRIIVGSATSPESLESATAIAAWLDECGQHQFTREAWEAVNRRLAVATRIGKGRMLLTTTPYEFGWFKFEVYDRWKQGDKNISVIQGDSKDNPAFPEEEYERQRGLLPRWKFNMFYRGIFEKPAGLIYDAFDENVCLIPRFTLPESWPRYVGHDFGPNNTAAVWYAQDPATSFLYVYRDYHAGGLSAHDHAQKWKTLSVGENIIKRVGGAVHEDGWREAFTIAGWPIGKPRERGVEVGINTVYGYHQQNKMFVFNDLTGYLDEKLSYSRELDENYEPTAKIDSKSTFHRMDAERYIISDLMPERANYNQTAKIVSHHNRNDSRTRPSNFSDVRSNNAQVKRHY